MENNNNDSSNPQKEQFFGDDKYVRLDQRTKISLMSAIMFALDGSITPYQAVDYALTIDRVTGDKLREIKRRRELKFERKPQ